MIWKSFEDLQPTVLDIKSASAWYQVGLKVKLSGTTRKPLSVGI